MSFYNENIQLVECPRDAMQGWHAFIPTPKKIEYINSLLQVGFHTIDFGSFVSAKAIPQMADTAEVLRGLAPGEKNSRLLAIVANERGAKEAAGFDAITDLGFPFSVSPTFQMRNTNSTMEESLKRLDGIKNICDRHSKQLVVYLSMGFGNPYGDPYDQDVLLHWAEEMVGRSIRIISLADTVGIARPEQISFALNALQPAYPDVIFGVHLHSSQASWRSKLEAALHAGSRRIDGALMGIGGCPMAQDSLVGNMSTENIIALMEEENQVTGVDRAALSRSLELASRLFQ